MEARINKEGSNLMKKVVNSNQKNGWKQKTESTKNEMGITEEDLEGSKQMVKNIVKKKTHKYFKEKIENDAKDKSKMKYYFEGKKAWSPRKRSAYMDKLTRNQTSTIFQARTRMLKVKGNYKNGTKDLKCRVCKGEDETQQHILEVCKGIHQSQGTKVTKEDIFDENPNNLKKTATKIDYILQILGST